MNRLKALLRILVSMGIHWRKVNVLFLCIRIFPSILVFTLVFTLTMKALLSVRVWRVLFLDLSPVAGLLMKLVVEGLFSCVRYLCLSVPLYGNYKYLLLRYGSILKY